MYLKKGYKIPTKRSYVDKNISDSDYGDDNFSQPYSHVFGKIFVAASLIRSMLKVNNPEIHYND